MRHWGLYNRQLNQWLLEKEPSNDYDSISRIVFYPLKEIAEAHHRRMIGLYGTRAGETWQVQEFWQDDQDSRPIEQQ